MLVDDLKALLGDDDAAVFIFAFGGQRIYIPKVITKNRTATYRATLIQMLGAGKAKLLFEAYGGDYMNVPTQRRGSPRTAQRKVAEMQRQGMKINEMAQAVNRSRRTIFRWLNLPHTNLTEKR